MSRLLLPSRSISQPPGAADIKWNDPLARGLRICLDVNNYTDIIRNLPLSGLDANFQRAVTQTGEGLGFSGNQTPAQLTLPASNFHASGKFSIATGWFTPSTAAHSLVCDWAGNPYSWISQAATTYYAGFASQQDIANIKSAGVVSTTRLNNFVQTNNGPDLAIYQDGVAQSLTDVWVAGSVTTPLISGNPITIGSTAEGKRLAGSLVWFYAWDRALSPAEAKAISENPWRIRGVQKRVVYFYAGAGGAATLTGANSSQDNVSSTGAITQTHAVNGANASQANSSSAASIVQIHTLLGADVTQINNSSAGAASQAHILTGANASQDSTSTTGSVTQTHPLTGANSDQANAATSGAISQTSILTGANSSQANASSSSGITQTHLLSGANSTQSATSGAGAIIIGSGIVLAGANASQDNASTTGSIGQTHILVGANTSQANLSSSAAIAQFFTLSGANASQGNDSSSGAITQTHILVGANASQANQSGAGGINGGATGNTGDGAHFDLPVDYLPLHLSARVFNRIEHQAAIAWRIAGKAKIARQFKHITRLP